MKNDRELLELAAKAAEVALYWPDDATFDVGFVLPLGPLRPNHKVREKRDWVTWNPLTDDGDALRLAGKLFISIGPEIEDVIGKSLVRVSWSGHSHSLGEYGDGDYQTAMRRAIVRAAAAIGESIP